MSRAREFDRWDIDFDDREQLQNLYLNFYPGGSGPLGLMRLICTMLEQIAKERGFEPLKKPGE